MEIKKQGHTKLAENVREIFESEAATIIQEFENIGATDIRLKAEIKERYYEDIDTEVEYEWEELFIKAFTKETQTREQAEILKENGYEPATANFFKVITLEGAPEKI